MSKHTTKHEPQYELWNLGAEDVLV
jgi:hypothetical protein